MPSASYDAVIIGASVAGCSAAILLGRMGLKVALLEKKQSIEDYKRICTTFIQASALPTIERLGLKDGMEAAGAVRNSFEMWTPWGRLQPPLERPDYAHPKHGYSIRRSVMDPLFRRAAAATPGVELILGAQFEDFTYGAGGAARGVRFVDADNPSCGGAIDARLIVAADGRQSRAAAVLRVPTKARQNQRACFYAFYAGLPLHTGRVSQYWMKDDDLGCAYPFSEGQTMLCCWVNKSRLPLWKRDVGAAFVSFFSDRPEAPDFSGAAQVSRSMGMVKFDDYRRPAAWKGVALIGDAALCADPMWGIGIGWALQSAEWLADAVGPAFQRGAALEVCLERYRRMHRERLWGHELFISDAARRGRSNFVDDLIVRAAVRDPKLGKDLYAFISRHIGPSQFLAPRNLVRMIAGGLRRPWRGALTATPPAAQPDADALRPVERRIST